MIRRAPPRLLKARLTLGCEPSRGPAKRAASARAVKQSARCASPAPLFFLCPLELELTLAESPARSSSKPINCNVRPAGSAQLNSARLAAKLASNRNSGSLALLPISICLAGRPPPIGRRANLRGAHLDAGRSAESLSSWPSLTSATCAVALRARNQKDDSIIGGAI